MAAMQGMAGAAVLLLVGADRDEQIVRQGATIRIRGTSDIFGLIQDRMPFHRLHVTRNYFKQARRADISGYRHIVNLITEPEDNDRVLENVRRLARESQARIVNPAEAVLRSTRDQVARRLEGVSGLVVPKVARLKSGAGIRRTAWSFPIIVRQTGTHTGKIVGLFDSEAQLREAEIGPGEHLVTQFVDFRSPDGFYRKYRAFFIGEGIILRHMLVSDHWNVHAKDRMRFMADRTELVAEEKNLFENPQGPFPAHILDTLRAVRDRMPLDFFGMDFGILPDGQLLLFEANASMNFFPFLADPKFAYLQRCWAPARRAFIDLLGIGGPENVDRKSERERA